MLNQQESKGSSLRKTAHRSPRIIQGQFGDDIDVLIVELNTFANPTPFSSKNISTYIAEFLVSKGADDIIKQFSIGSFKLNIASGQWRYLTLEEERMLIKNFD